MNLKNERNINAHGAANALRNARFTNPIHMNRVNLILSSALAALLALSIAGCQSHRSPAPSLSPEERADRLAQAQARLAELEPKIARLEAAPSAQLAEIVHELGLGDAEFEAARRMKIEADKELKQIGYTHLPGHPQYREKARLVGLSAENLASRANWIRYQLTREGRLVRDTVARLQAPVSQP